MANLSDADALLAAVWASPHDDLPRLVYADFIEERGHPGDADRAEFIRLQIAREAAEAVGDDVADEDHWREEELFEANKRAWLAGGDWRPYEVKSAGREAYHRGFPAPETHVISSRTHAEPSPVPPQRVTVWWDQPPEASAACLDLPDVQRAEILVLASEGELTVTDFRALAGVNGLDCVRAMTLWVENGGRGADSEWLARLGPVRLHRLDLRPWSPDGPAFDALAASPLAGRLTSLRWDSGFGPYDLRTLAASTAFPRLRVLSLPSGEIAGADLAAVAASPLGLQLRELDPPWNMREPADHYRAIAATPLSRLKVLRLPFHLPLDAEVVRLICRAPHLAANLRELHAPPDNRVAGMLTETFGHRLRPLRSWARVRAGGG